MLEFIGLLVVLAVGFVVVRAIIRGIYRARQIDERSIARSHNEKFDLSPAVKILESQLRKIRSHGISPLPDLVWLAYSIIVISAYNSSASAKDAKELLELVFPDEINEHLDQLFKIACHDSDFPQTVSKLSSVAENDLKQAEPNYLVRYQLLQEEKNKKLLTERVDPRTQDHDDWLKV